MAECYGLVNNKCEKKSMTEYLKDQDLTNVKADQDDQFYTLGKKMRNVKADDIKLNNQEIDDKEIDLMRNVMKGYFQWEQELAMKGEIKLNHELEFD